MDKKKKVKKERASFLEQFRHLKTYLVQAGIKMEPNKVFKLLFTITGIIDISLLSFIIYNIVVYDTLFIFIIIVSIVMITLGNLLIFLGVWLAFMLVLDYLKFKRKTAMEEVLPEFLRLVSANHRAGLPFEMALWKANRPRFGVLSEEINEVAKHTYATGDLIKPLRKFSEKYDSKILRRVVSNILEGIKTGADIATLLDDVSSNITNIRNTRKELASEVEHYMLFIALTVLIISPLMFALANKMSGVIENVKNTLAETISGDAGSAASLPIEVEFGKTKDFDYFFDIFNNSRHLIS
jgi:flagellar protein FlaJ